MKRTIRRMKRDLPMVALMLTMLPATVKRCCHNITGYNNSARYAYKSYNA